MPFADKGKGAGGRAPYSCALFPFRIDNRDCDLIKIMPLLFMIFHCCTTILRQNYSYNTILTYSYEIPTIQHIALPLPQLFQLLPRNPYCSLIPLLLTSLHPMLCTLCPHHHHHHQHSPTAVLLLLVALETCASDTATYTRLSFISLVVANYSRFCFFEALEFMFHRHRPM